MSRQDHFQEVNTLVNTLELTLTLTDSTTNEKIQYRQYINNERFQEIPVEAYSQIVSVHVENLIRDIFEERYRIQKDAS